jgi:hypothetical protein
MWFRTREDNSRGNGDTCWVEVITLYVDFAGRIARSDNNFWNERFGGISIFRWRNMIDILLWNFILIDVMVNSNVR